MALCGKPHDFRLLMPLRGERCWPQGSGTRAQGTETSRKSHSSRLTLTPPLSRLGLKQEFAGRGIFCLRSG